MLLPAQRRVCSPFDCFVILKRFTESLATTTRLPRDSLGTSKVATTKSTTSPPSRAASSISATAAKSAQIPADPKLVSQMRQVALLYKRSANILELRFSMSA